MSDRSQVYVSAFNPQLKRLTSEVRKPCVKPLEDFGIAHQGCLHRTSSLSGCSGDGPLYAAYPSELPGPTRRQASCMNLSLAQRQSRLAKALMLVPSLSLRSWSLETVTPKH